MPHDASRSHSNPAWQRELTSRHPLIPGSILAELASAFGLEEVRERRVTDVSFDRLSRNLGVLAALAGDGMGLLPVVPDAVTAEVTSPEQAVEKSHRLTAAVADKGTGSLFDEAAAAALDRRRELISKQADGRPQQVAPEGAHGWTHGDMQYRNLLWDGEELAAVLDWDRVGVRPYAEEVARTAQVQFGVDGVFDLARVSAFVGGYRSVMPLEDSALADGVRRLWWKRMTDFWQLEFHYDRGDFSCDELFTADEVLLHWWTDRLDQVEDAFAAG
ncbi:phosphotransferase [Streptomyces sp. NPDC001401]|uniref:phosphotransferase n=1 Tax=Streptomyces sp. NPDC001401 TaxID=3364570 RepID=UPI0036BDB742